MIQRHPVSLLGSLLLVLSSTACGVGAAAPTNTPVPATATPPAATATPVTVPPATATEAPGPASIEVAFPGVSFAIPAGLATGAKPENVAAMDNEPVPAWEKAPAYLQITLQEYAVKGALLPPIIAIFPATKYSADNDGAAQSLQRLRTLITAPTGTLDNQSVPFVPFFNANQSFSAQPRLIKFQGGTGVRMLTQYDQGPIPANNHELIYHFEGLTDDGNAYVIVILPINSSLLASDEHPDSPVPPGGIAFNSADPRAYFASVTAELGAAAADSFTPSMASLDKLVQSLHISAP